jgi:hypothetical protein
VNLDDCIAITQNYVGSQNLKETMEFLYLKRDQVSGVADDRQEGLYEEFKEAFFKSNWTPSEGEEANTVLTMSVEEVDRKRALMRMWEENEREIEQLSKAVQRCKGGASDGNAPEKLSFWELAKRGGVAAGKEGESGADATEGGSGGGGFSFSFGFASDDEEDGEPDKEEPLEQGDDKN